MNRFHKEKKEMAEDDATQSFYNTSGNPESIGCFDQRWFDVGIGWAGLLAPSFQEELAHSGQTYPSQGDCPTHSKTSCPTSREQYRT
tara:strand:- start:5930 stop:6190 length:261 start_codon:yes stop_codon:yes gene_type:complete